MGGRTVHYRQSDSSIENYYLIDRSRKKWTKKRHNLDDAYFYEGCAVLAVVHPSKNKIQ